MTSYRWKIVSASKYNGVRQPVISIWPPKPEIITSVELLQVASKFQRQIRDFRCFSAPAKWLRQRSTTRNCMIGEQNVYIVISGCRSLSQSPGISFFSLGVFEKPRFAIPHWNCHPICYGSRDISISGFGGNIVISGCRSLSQSLGDTLYGLAMVDNPGLAVGIRRYLL